MRKQRQKLLVALIIALTVLDALLPDSLIGEASTTLRNLFHALQLVRELL